jgi:hypothetical protein
MKEMPLVPLQVRESVPTRRCELSLSRQSQDLIPRCLFSVLVRPPVWRALYSHRYAARNLTARLVANVNLYESWPVLDEGNFRQHAESIPIAGKLHFTAI